jgi:hypothetical protein
MLCTVLIATQCCCALVAGAAIISNVLRAARNA